MPRVLCIALFVCLAIVLTGCADNAFQKKQAEIADAIEKIPASNVKLFLYSLNPHDSRIFERTLPENSDEVFHRFPILGRVEIVSAQEKEKLLKSFARGVRKSNGLEAACFDPRHGIRIISDRTTNDFVICFECLQVESYGFNSIEGFLISDSPSPTFNKFLDDYRIKKAE